jgi:hypothetical protein
MALTLDSKPRLQLSLRPGIVSKISSEAASNVSTETTAGSSTRDPRSTERCECGQHANLPPIDCES